MTLAKLRSEVFPCASLSVKRVSLKHLIVKNAIVTVCRMWELAASGGVYFGFPRFPAVWHREAGGRGSRGRNTTTALAFDSKRCHLRKRTVYDFQLRRNHGNNSDLSRKTRGCVKKHWHTNTYVRVFTLPRASVALSVSCLFSEHNRTHAVVNVFLLTQLDRLTPQQVYCCYGNSSTVVEEGCWLVSCLLNSTNMLNIKWCKQH